MINTFKLFEMKKRKNKLDRDYIGNIAILEDPEYAWFHKGRFYWIDEEIGYSFVIGAQKFFDGIWLIAEKEGNENEDTLDWFNSEKFKIIPMGRKSSEIDPYGEELWEID